LIERSFQELSRAIETVEIVEELVKIGLNEVCDKDIFGINHITKGYMVDI